MRYQIANQKEFAGGILFLIIGAGWSLFSLQYDLGRPTRMGPGLFPLIAAIALMVVGVASILRAVRSREQVGLGSFPLVSFLFVTAGVIGFGLLVRSAGLVAASVVVVALCCYRRWRTNPVEVVALCVVYTIVVVLIFVYGLGLPLNIW